MLLSQGSRSPLKSSQQSLTIVTLLPLLLFFRVPTGGHDLAVRKIGYGSTESPSINDIHLLPRQKHFNKKRKIKT